MGFEKDTLNENEVEELKKLSILCKGDILKMTTLASSGHPGGSMSTLDILLLLYKYANIYPNDPENPKRDRIVVSHGHISPAV
jgi:transketolase